MEGPEGEVPADREIIETYRDGTALVTQFVAMYRLPARGSGLTKSLKTIADPDTWHVVETWTAPVVIDGMATSVDMAWITRRGRRRLVWYFYIVDDRATANTFEAKLLQVRTALVGGDHFGEFLAISTESNDDATAAATLTRFLKTMGPLQGVRPFRIE
jgi:EpsI family protein